MHKVLYIQMLGIILSCLFFSTVRAEEVLIIGVIDFEGNETFSSKLLRPIVRIKSGDKFDEFFVKIGKNRLINYYMSQGFLDVDIKWERRLVQYKVDNIIHIKEGRRAKVDTVIFNGNNIFDDNELTAMSYIKTGGFLIQYEIFNTRYNVLKAYSKKGYIRAQVTTDTLQKSKYHYVLTLNIKEGHPVYIGDINIRGNQRVRRKIIEREFKVKQGDLYNPEKVNETQIGIYSTGLFEFVKYDVVEYTDRDTVELVFSVKERPPRSITFGTGYVYSDKNPNRLSVKIGWRHNNVWGNAQKFAIKPHYETDFSEYKKGRLELAYEESYFLNTTFKSGVNVYIQREKRDDEEEDIIGTNVNLGKYLGRYTQAAIRYQFEDLIKESDHTWISSLLLSISCDKKNDIFYPSRGVVSLLTHEYAGRLLGGDVDFQKLVMENILYKRITYGVLATRIKAGCIWEDRNIPDNQKFAIGGMGSVRGYDQESIGPEVGARRKARVMLVMNVEFRLTILSNFELTYFIDTGGLWNALQDINLTENTGISGGVGIGYRSPIGPIRLDYAHRLKGPNGGNFYLTIGYMY